MRFYYPFRVRYHECDLQGHVFNAHYMTYVDVAVMEYFRTLGFALDPSDPQVFDFTLVRFEIDFHSGVRFDEDMLVGLRCERIGSSSFDLHFVLMRAADDSICAEGAGRYVAFITRERKSQPVPADVRAAIARFEGWEQAPEGNA